MSSDLHTGKVTPILGMGKAQVPAHIPYPHNFLVKTPVSAPGDNKQIYCKTAARHSSTRASCVLAQNK